MSKMRARLASPWTALSAALLSSGRPASLSFSDVAKRDGSRRSGLFDRERNHHLDRRAALINPTPSRRRLFRNGVSAIPAGGRQFAIGTGEYRCNKSWFLQAHAATPRMDVSCDQESRGSDGEIVQSEKSAASALATECGNQYRAVSRDFGGHAAILRRRCAQRINPRELGRRRDRRSWDFVRRPLCRTMGRMAAWATSPQLPQPTHPSFTYAPDFS